MSDKKITLGEILALLLLSIYMWWKLGTSGFVAMDDKYIRLGWAILFLFLMIWAIFDWLKDDDIETTTGNIFKLLRRSGFFILLVVGFYIKVFS